MKKKRRISKPKPQKFSIIMFSYEDPMNFILHVIGFIIMIYGAWFHNILWLISGFIPMIVGNWWESVHKNGKRK
jgi:hypothetical protein|nr:hypothetical protein [Nanoarchaeum sp.]